MSDPLILREIEEELHQEVKQPEKPKDHQQSEPLNVLAEDSSVVKEKYTFQGVLKCVFSLSYEPEYL